MNRFIRLTAIAAVSLAASLAHALDIQPYSAAALGAAQQAGKPVAVHFHAEWCSTCKTQEKALNALKEEKGLDITVLIANYDEEKDLKKQYKVRSQSVLIVFKGEQEKARLAGDTDIEKIRSALQAGL
ncbi:thioredoxin family protein [Methyloversatilis sp.]|uniref:thioredoxin family protein n=1 Tax=Methyloversatilis sp. TaxID=2569862 RepID=UPI0027BB05CF|nr:thioredoxin family protein [Methyloversatilis sp.]